MRRTLLYRIVHIVLVALLFYGCITRFGEDPSTIRAKLARSHLTGGQWLRAFEILESDFLIGGANRDRALALVQEFPGFRAGVETDVAGQIQKIEDIEAALHLKRQISSLARTGSVAPEKTDELMAKLMRDVAEKNRTGRALFLLTSELREFPGLLEADSVKLIFDRSVDALRKQKYPESALVSKIFDYARDKGVRSSEHVTLGAALSQIPFSVAQLETTVRLLFPDFAERALKELRVVVQLKSDPARRLLEEDLATALRVHGDVLRIIRDSEPEAIVVTVRELQLEQRQQPERVQTMVVSYGDHDLLVGALLLPRNATTQFEFVQGGAEIEFAYEIIAEKDGQRIYERLLRDSVRGAYQFCSNMRVVNVFGGVQAVSAFPNQQVAALCQRGQQPVSVTALRPDVIRRVAQEIGAIPAIQKAIERSK